MQMDFHYYATYCAAYLAGYAPDECLTIAYSTQLVDVCSAKFLKSMGAPAEAATVQMAEEIMDMNPNTLGRQELSRIFTSFHFLPFDLYAPVAKGTGAYKNKYRLLCGPNGDLLVQTVENAKDAGLQAVGIAMHVLADTWAHRYFAGTPSLVINEVSDAVYEVLSPEKAERKVTFKHDPRVADDVDAGVYINSLSQFDEYSIMNMGHDRIGRLPDYSFATYRYIPAWGDYRRLEKDNPQDYLRAFCQMITAMKYLRGETPAFERDTYDTEAIEDYRETIEEILCTRAVDTCAEWKTFGESLSEETIPDFNIEQYRQAYLESGEESFLGEFIATAQKQKQLVTAAVSSSGNSLLGHLKEERGTKGNE